jgi:hypothetical protein
MTRFKFLLTISFISAFCLCNAQTKTAIKTGENFILLDGNSFHNAKILLKPNASGYDNLWFDSGKQKFTDINMLGNYDGRKVNFQLRFPGQTGTYTIENNRNDTGSQNNDNACYLLMSDKDTYGDSAGFGGQTGSVKVTITRYDSVGGLIEGNFTGTLSTDWKDKNELSISGNFSFIRGKDKKSF